MDIGQIDLIKPGTFEELELPIDEIISVSVELNPFSSTTVSEALRIELLRTGRFGSLKNVEDAY